MNTESNTARNLSTQPSARSLFADPPLFLVGAARVLGEPLHLYGAARRRRRRAFRLWNYGVPTAATQAQRIGPRIRAPARRHRDALRHRGHDDHVHRVHRGHLLLSRCAPRRTSRPQHSVLEIAAGLGSHHCPLEAVRSPGDPAGAHLCRSSSRRSLSCCYSALRSCSRAAWLAPLGAFYPGPACR